MSEQRPARFVPEERPTAFVGGPNVTFTGDWYGAIGDSDRVGNGQPGAWFTLPPSLWRWFNKGAAFVPPNPRLEKATDGR